MSLCLRVWGGDGLRRLFAETLPSPLCLQAPLPLVASLGPSWLPLAVEAAFAAQPAQRVSQWEASADWSLEISCEDAVGYALAALSRRAEACTHRRTRVTVSPALPKAVRQRLADCGRQMAPFCDDLGLTSLPDQDLS